MADDGKIVLLGCGKMKHPTRLAAADLYASPLWRARCAYAEASGRPWFILSALHGLVDPTRQLEPYNVALADRPARERREWGTRVVDELERVVGPLPGLQLEVHAGSAYVNAIAPEVAARGAALLAPLAGVAGIGSQLAWYRAVTSEPAGSPPRRQACTVNEVEDALNALDRTPKRVSAHQWPSDLEGIDVPGLYAWWVDDAGADDLSEALGLPLAAGRIYAGLTGATKWPSGATGNNTLRSRVRGSHIRGRIRGSTFRFTLASLLRGRLDLDD